MFGRLKSKGRREHKYPGSSQEGNVVSVNRHTEMEKGNECAVNTETLPQTGLSSENTNLVGIRADSD